MCWYDFLLLSCNPLHFLLPPSLSLSLYIYIFITWVDMQLMTYHQKDPSNDPNIGSARGSNKSSTSDALQTVGITASTSGMALLSTFLPAFILAVVCFLIFLVCRRTQRRFYSPRSYLGHMHDQYVVIDSSHQGTCRMKCYI